MLGPIGLAVLLAMSIANFVTAFYLSKSNTYKDIKSQNDCSSALMNVAYKEGEDCPVWDGSQCRKGKYSSSDKTCISKGNVLPLIFLIGGVALLVSFFVSLYYYYKQ